MKLVENSKEVAKHSWSVRLITLAAMLETLSLSAPVLLPELANFVDPLTLSKISLGLMLGGIVARFIKQTKVSG